MDYNYKFAHRNAPHSYDVMAYADKNARLNKNFIQKTFVVSATNRDQAARLVERDGYEVCSVNMVG